MILKKGNSSQHTLRSLLLLGVFLFAGSASIKAQWTEVTNISTGVDNTTSAMINIDSPDDSWIVYRPSSGGPGFPQGWGSPIVEYISAWAAPVNSRWISAYPITPFSPINQQPQGTYEFKITFNISTLPCAVSSAVIQFPRISSDNSISSLKVNGNAYAFTASGYTTFANKMVTINTAHLVQGTNTISIFIVNNAPQNTGANYCALYAEGTVTVNYKNTNPLTPSFNAQSTYCLNDILTFTGSDGDGTADHHLWEVYECDAQGNITNLTPVYSMWFVNSPGVFTLPNTSSYVCNRYYRIKLVTTNSCTNWAETSKVFFLRCNPTPTITSSEPNPLCYGESTVLTTNYTPSVSTTILWNTGASTSSITVTPNATTTYSVNVVSKGCPGTATYTTNVNTVNNPGFTLNGSATTGYPYFNVSAIPIINPGANGINYYWDVVEINPNTGAEITGTKVYNPSCWWALNGTTSFQNYNYNTTYNNTNNGLLNANNFGCSATTGRFESNHTYRFTRATWSANCPWTIEVQNIMLCPTCRTNGGSEIIVLSKEQYSSENLPEEMGYLRSSIDNKAIITPVTAIFPNPSSGLFNIQFDIDGEKQIQIYDATGKLISNEQTVDQLLNIDLSSQQAGLYLCRITTIYGTETRHIVIE